MEQTGEIAAGQLLIATQPGRGGYFDRTVILLLDHRPMGTVGLTLNVPSEIDVAEALPTFVPYLRPLPGIWEGGPVNGEVAIVLGEVATSDSAPPGWQRLLRDVGVVDMSFPPELLDASFSQLRAFVGLSAWSPGQLENELLRGSWFRAWARPDDIFGDPDGLWRRVLRRMGGAAGRWSTWAEEPALN